MASNTTANRITLAKNGSIPIDPMRLFNDSKKSAETALVDLFALTWAVLLNNGTVGKANELVAIGTEIFGEEMEKAMDACVEGANPGMTEEEKVTVKNGHKQIGGLGGKDAAVSKLAGLFWLLVGAKRMGQAEKIRVMGNEAQREGGLEFEEMVDIMGKTLVE